MALPLIIALITSAIAVDRLANRSQTAVYEAVQATQSCRRLSEVLTTMERSARQIVILNDRSLLDAYKISRGQFEETAAQFSDLPFDAGQRAELAAIIATERQIFDALSNTRLKPDTLRAQVSRFVELASHAQSIMAKSAALIDREVEAMRDSANEARRVMLWQALALIPVMIFLIFGFTILISRPIRQLDFAIRELGDGKFNAPVVVNGPADLEFLGGRLEWMRRQLIDLEQQKIRFLQQVSHELKTPLTALREGAQLLSDDVVGSLTPEQREIVQILRHNSLDLQEQIEELLNYGAIQFQKPKLDLAPVDPRQILEQVAQSQTLARQAKNLAFKSQSANLTMMADAEKLRVVIDNLLSNAIRFSPVGGTIGVRMQAEDGTADHRRDRRRTWHLRGGSTARIRTVLPGAGAGVRAGQRHGARTVDRQGMRQGTRRQHRGGCNACPARRAFACKIAAPPVGGRVKQLIGLIVVLAALLNSGCSVLRTPDFGREPWVREGGLFPSGDNASLLMYFEYVRKLPPAELAKEHETVRQLYANANSDFVRVRYAMLLSVPGTAASDDARALEVLDPVLKNSGGGLHALAFVLSAQIQEQKRGQALQQKLDALMSLEKSLIERDPGATKRR